MEVVSDNKFIQTIKYINKDYIVTIYNIQYT